MPPEIVPLIRASAVRLIAPVNMEPKTLIAPVAGAVPVQPVPAMLKVLLKVAVSHQRLGKGLDVDGAAVAKRKRTAILRVDANTRYEIRDASEIAVNGADRKSQGAAEGALIIDRTVAGERIGDVLIVVVIVIQHTVGVDM